MCADPVCCLCVCMQAFEGNVYAKGKEPKMKPTQMDSDVHTEHAKSVQKHEAAKFNVMGTLERLLVRLLEHP